MCQDRSLPSAAFNAFYAVQSLRFVQRLPFDKLLRVVSQVEPRSVQAPLTLTVSAE